MESLSHRPGKIADAFKIDDELQAGEQLAGFAFADVGDGAGDLLVDLALHAIEFFFAVADRQQRHLGRILDVVEEVAGGVFGDQAGLLHQSGEFFGGIAFGGGAALHGQPA